MTYSPKIYIRDYGSPEKSIFVYSMPIDVDLQQADVLRSLNIDWENPLAGDEGILLSGDVQVTGTDRLTLSGINGVELLAHPSTLRVVLHEAEVLTGVFIDTDTCPVTVTTRDVVVTRHLIERPDPLDLVLDLRPVTVLRDLLVIGSTLGSAVTLHDVDIIITSYILLSGDAQVGGRDKELLSGDAQVGGTDAITQSE